MGVRHAGKLAKKAGLCRAREASYAGLFTDMSLRCGPPKVVALDCRHLIAAIRHQTIKSNELRENSGKPHLNAHTTYHKERRHQRHP